MKSKRIDPVCIRKAVKDSQLKFYVKDNIIYCEELPETGEIFIVGRVNNDNNSF